MSRVALITGGQQGIGLGVAEALVAGGFAVALVAEAPEDGHAAGAALEALGSKARYFHHDLRGVEGLGGLIDRIEDALGPITTLVSNAGVASPRRGDMLDLAVESFDFVLGVNLRGGFFLAQEVARRMAGRSADEFRALVFVTSVSAGMVSVERAEYCISKAGASMMARLFAARLAPIGIGAYEVRPGIIATGMTAGVRDRYDAAIGDGLVPAGRWGEPRDVGAAVRALAEGDMAFATGAVIPVDGGLSIPRL